MLIRGGPSDLGLFAPSPDGRLIAYARAGGASENVWLMRPDGTRQRRLAEGTYPTWAPDGRQLAFVNGTSLMAIGVDGSGRREIFRPGDGSSPLTPVWAPSGDWIAFATFDELWAVRPDGSDAHRVAAAYTLGSGFGRAPANYGWSPDGKRLTFVAIANGTDIFTVPVEGGAPTRLTDTVNEDEYPRWSPDGAEIAFFRGDEGVFVVPSAGGAAEPVTRGFAPTWSPSGSRLAVLRGAQVYLVRPDGGGLRRVTRGTSDTAHSPPAWMPDGKTILVARSAPYLPSELYTISERGGPMRRITRNGIEETYPSWSPDGRMIAFTGVIDPMHRSEPEIYVVRSDGTRLRRLTRHPGPDWQPAWAPDGKRIVFVRNPARPALYTVSLADGKIRPVGGTRGGFNPAWSPNGRWIAVDGIHLVRPNGQRGPTITHPPANGEFNPDADVDPDWAPGGGRLAFIRIHWICPRCDEPSLWVVDSSGANAREVSGGAADVSWSPDGRRLALATPEGLTTMRPDGSGTRVVSRAVTDAVAIDWGPARK